MDKCKLKRVPKPKWNCCRKDVWELAQLEYQKFSFCCSCHAQDCWSASLCGAAGWWLALDSDTAELCGSSSSAVFQNYKSNFATENSEQLLSVFVSGSVVMKVILNYICTVAHCSITILYTSAARLHHNI